MTSMAECAGLPENCLRPVIPALMAALFVAILAPASPTVPARSWMRPNPLVQPLPSPLAWILSTASWYRLPL